MFKKYVSFTFRSLISRMKALDSLKQKKSMAKCIVVLMHCCTVSDTL